MALPPVYEHSVTGKEAFVYTCGSKAYYATKEYIDAFSGEMQTVANTIAQMYDSGSMVAQAKTIIFAVTDEHQCAVLKKIFGPGITITTLEEARKGKEIYVPLTILPHVNSNKDYTFPADAYCGYCFFAEVEGCTANADEVKIAYAEVTNLLDTSLKSIEARMKKQGTWLKKQEGLAKSYFATRYNEDLEAAKDDITTLANVLKRYEFTTNAKIGDSFTEVDKCKIKSVRARAGETVLLLNTNGTKCEGQISADDAADKLKGHADALAKAKQAGAAGGGGAPVGPLNIHKLQSEVDDYRSKLQTEIDNQNRDLQQQEQARLAKNQQDADAAASAKARDEKKHVLNVFGPEKRRIQSIQIYEWTRAMVQCLVIHANQVLAGYNTACTVMASFNTTYAGTLSSLHATWQQHTASITTLMQENVDFNATEENMKGKLQTLKNTYLQDWFALFGKVGPMDKYILDAVRAGNISKDNIRRDGDTTYEEISPDVPATLELWYEENYGKGRDKDRLPACYEFKVAAAAAERQSHQAHVATPVATPAPAGPASTSTPVTSGAPSGLGKSNFMRGSKVSKKLTWKKVKQQNLPSQATAIVLASTIIDNARRRPKPKYDLSTKQGYCNIIDTTTKKATEYMKTYQKEVDKAKHNSKEAAAKVQRFKTAYEAVTGDDAISRYKNLEAQYQMQTAQIEALDYKTIYDRRKQFYKACQAYVTTLTDAKRDASQSTSELKTSIETAEKALAAAKDKANDKAVEGRDDLVTAAQATYDAGAKLYTNIAADLSWRKLEEAYHNMERVQPWPSDLDLQKRSIIAEITTTNKQNLSAEQAKARYDQYAQKIVQLTDTANQANQVAADAKAVAEQQRAALANEQAALAAAFNTAKKQWREVGDLQAIWQTLDPQEYARIGGLWSDLSTAQPVQSTDSKFSKFASACNALFDTARREAVKQVTEARSKISAVDSALLPPDIQRLEAGLPSLSDASIRQMDIAALLQILPHCNTIAAHVDATKAWKKIQGVNPESLTAEMQQQFGLLKKASEHQLPIDNLKLFTANCNTFAERVEQHQADLAVANAARVAHKDHTGIIYRDFQDGSWKTHQGDGVLVIVPGLSYHTLNKDNITDAIRAIGSNEKVMNYKGSRADPPVFEYGKADTILFQFEKGPKNFKLICGSDWSDDAVAFTTETIIKTPTTVEGSTNMLQFTLGIMHEIMVNDWKPSTILCGSKGGLICLPLILKHCWQGPVVCLNGQCVYPTGIRIPKEVPMCLVHAEKDEMLGDMNNLQRNYTKNTEKGSEALVLELANENHAFTLSVEYLKALLAVTPNTLPYNAVYNAIQDTRNEVYAFTHRGMEKVTFAEEPINVIRTLDTAALQGQSDANAAAVAAQKAETARIAAEAEAAKAAQQAAEVETARIAAEAEQAAAAAKAAAEQAAKDAEAKKQAAAKEKAAADQAAAEQAAAAKEKAEAEQAAKDAEAKKQAAAKEKAAAAQAAKDAEAKKQAAAKEKAAADQAAAEQAAAAKEKAEAAETLRLQREQALDAAIDRYLAEADDNDFWSVERMLEFQEDSANWGANSDQELLDYLVDQEADEESMRERIRARRLQEAKNTAQEILRTLMEEEIYLKGTKLPTADQSAMHNAQNDYALAAAKLETKLQKATAVDKMEISPAYEKELLAVLSETVELQKTVEAQKAAADAAAAKAPTGAAAKLKDDKPTKPKAISLKKSVTKRKKKKISKAARAAAVSVAAVAPKDAKSAAVEAGSEPSSLPEGSGSDTEEDASSSKSEGGSGSSDSESVTEEGEDGDDSDGSQYSYTVVYNPASSSNVEDDKSFSMSESDSDEKSPTAGSPGKKPEPNNVEMSKSMPPESDSDDDWTEADSEQTSESDSESGSDMEADNDSAPVPGETGGGGGGAAAAGITRPKKPRKKKDAIASYNEFKANYAPESRTSLYATPRIFTCPNLCGYETCIARQFAVHKSNCDKTVSEEPSVETQKSLIDDVKGATQTFLNIAAPLQECSVPYDFVASAATFPVDKLSIVDDVLVDTVSCSIAATANIKPPEPEYCVYTEFDTDFVCTGVLVKGELYLLKRIKLDAKAESFYNFVALAGNTDNSMTSGGWQDENTIVLQTQQSEFEQSNQMKFTTLISRNVIDRWIQEKAAEDQLLQQVLNHCKTLSTAHFTFNAPLPGLDENAGISVHSDLNIVEKSTGYKLKPHRFGLLPTAVLSDGTVESLLSCQYRTEENGPIIKATLTMPFEELERIKKTLVNWNPSDDVIQNAEIEAKHRSEDAIRLQQDLLDKLKAKKNAKEEFWKYKSTATENVNAVLKEWQKEINENESSQWDKPVVSAAVKFATQYWNDTKHYAPRSYNTFMYDAGDNTNEKVACRKSAMARVWRAELTALTNAQEAFVKVVKAREEVEEAKASATDAKAEARAADVGVAAYAAKVQVRGMPEPLDTTDDTKPQHTFVHVEKKPNNGSSLIKCATDTFTHTFGHEKNMYNAVQETTELEKQYTLSAILSKLSNQVRAATKLHKDDQSTYNNSFETVQKNNFGEGTTYTWQQCVQCLPAKYYWTARAHAHRTKAKAKLELYKRLSPPTREPTVINDCFEFLCMVNWKFWLLPETCVRFMTTTTFKGYAANLELEPMQYVQYAQSLARTLPKVLQLLNGYAMDEASKEARDGGQDEDAAEARYTASVFKKDDLMLKLQLDNDSWKVKGPATSLKEISNFPYVVDDAFAQRNNANLPQWALFGKGKGGVHLIHEEIELDGVTVAPKKPFTVTEEWLKAAEAQKKAAADEAAKKQAAARPPVVNMRDWRVGDVITAVIRQEDCVYYRIRRQINEFLWRPGDTIITQPKSAPKDQVSKVCMVERRLYTVDEAKAVVQLFANNLPLFAKGHMMRIEQAAVNYGFFVDNCSVVQHALASKLNEKKAVEEKILKAVASGTDIDTVMPIMSSVNTLREYQTSVKNYYFFPDVDPEGIYPLADTDTTILHVKAHFQPDDDEDDLDNQRDRLNNTIDASEYIENMQTETLPSWIQSVRPGLDVITSKVHGNVAKWQAEARVLFRNEKRKQGLIEIHEETDTYCVQIQEYFSNETGLNVTHNIARQIEQSCTLKLNPEGNVQLPNLPCLNDFATASGLFGKKKTQGKNVEAKDISTFEPFLHALGITPTKGGTYTFRQQETDDIVLALRACCFYGNAQTGILKQMLLSGSGVLTWPVLDLTSFALLFRLFEIPVKNIGNTLHYEFAPEWHSVLRKLVDCCAPQLRVVHSMNPQWLANNDNIDAKKQIEMQQYSYALEYIDYKTDADETYLVLRRLEPRNFKEWKEFVSDVFIKSSLSDSGLTYEHVEYFFTHFDSKQYPQLEIRRNELRQQRKESDEYMVQHCGEKYIRVFTTGEFDTLKDLADEDYVDYVLDDLCIRGRDYHGGWVIVDHHNDEIETWERMLLSPGNIIRMHEPEAPDGDFRANLEHARQAELRRYEALLKKSQSPKSTAEDTRHLENFEFTVCFTVLTPVSFYTLDNYALTLGIETINTKRRNLGDNQNQLPTDTWRPEWQTWHQALALLQGKDGEGGCITEAQKTMQLIAIETEDASAATPTTLLTANALKTAIRKTTLLDSKLTQLRAELKDRFAGRNSVFFASKQPQDADKFQGRAIMMRELQDTFGMLWYALQTIVASKSQDLDLLLNTKQNVFSPAVDPYVNTSSSTQIFHSRTWETHRAGGETHTETVHVSPSLACDLLANLKNATANNPFWIYAKHRYPRAAYVLANLSEPEKYVRADSFDNAIELLQGIILHNLKDFCQWMCIAGNTDMTRGNYTNVNIVFPNNLSIQIRVRQDKHDLRLWYATFQIQGEARHTFDLKEWSVAICCSQSVHSPIKDMLDDKWDNFNFVFTKIVGFFDLQTIDQHMRTLKKIQTHYDGKDAFLELKPTTLREILMPKREQAFIKKGGAAARDAAAAVTKPKKMKKGGGAKGDAATNPKKTKRGRDEIGGEAPPAAVEEQSPRDGNSAKGAELRQKAQGKKKETQAAAQKKADAGQEGKKGQPKRKGAEKKQGERKKAARVPARQAAQADAQAAAAAAAAAKPALVAEKGGAAGTKPKKMKKGGGAKGDAQADEQAGQEGKKGQPKLKGAEKKQGEQKKAARVPARQAAQADAQAATAAAAAAKPALVAEGERAPVAALPAENERNPPLVNEHGKKRRITPKLVQTAKAADAAASEIHKMKARREAQDARVAENWNPAIPPQFTAAAGGSASEKGEEDQGTDGESNGSEYMSDDEDDKGE